MSGVKLDVVSNSEESVDLSKLTESKNEDKLASPEPKGNNNLTFNADSEKSSSRVSEDKNTYPEILVTAED